MSRKVVVDKVYATPQDGITPLILQFQNGKMTNTNNVQFCRTRNKRTKEMGAVVIAGDNCYHGPVGAQQADQLVDTYIALCNKQTNKVRLVPVQTALLKHVLYDDLQEKELEGITTELANTKRLKEYGGRKAASRFAANTEKSNISIDLLKDDLQKTVDEVAEAAIETDNDEQNKSLESPIEEIRPKFNEMATTLKEIYQIEDLIPATLLQRLEEEAKVVFTTTADQLPIASEYLKSCLKTLQNQPQSQSNFLHVKIILYLDCLHTLLKSRVRNMRRQELSKITEKVENDVRSRFSDPKAQEMTRTNFTSEKALCYYIVLVLLINNKYEVDINVLIEDLSMSRDKLRKYAKIVNAILKPDGVLVLCLPSKMPKVQLRTRRRVK